VCVSANVIIMYVHICMDVCMYVCIRYGNDVDGWSDEHSFYSAPIPGDITHEVNFIAYADMGISQGDAAYSTAERVYEEVYT